MLILKNKIIIVNVVINGIKKKKNVCKYCELKFLIFVIVKIKFVVMEYVIVE